jgi:hypothetical protein
LNFGIPSLLPNKLALIVPTATYAGGGITDPSTTLFVWRSCSFPQAARGGVVGFFVDDYRFECLWNRPTFYAEQFAAFGWGAVIEPDFSTWLDMPLAEQLWSIFRMRTLGRLYQEHGIRIIPNLAWSDERSFAFCFQGIPQHAPAVACECRTPGGNDADRRAFLAGLSEGVRQVHPQHITVYGGKEHQHWLTPHLPSGPQYTLLESWTHARDRQRRQEKFAVKHRNQMKFNFPTRKEQPVWADEEAAAALA